MKLMRFGTMVVFSTGILVACGNTDPNKDDKDTSANDGGASSEDDYYPLAVGNYWRYKETDVNNIVTELTYTVTGTAKDTVGDEERDVFVIENFVIDDEIFEDDERRVQHVSDDGTRAERVRHTIEVWDVFLEELVPTKERWYEPGFLRFDRSKLSQGTSWTETLTRYSDSMDTSPVLEESMAYEFTVLSVDEIINVDAGEFSCIKIQRYSSADFDNETKTYWFAEGVGKVQEIDDDGSEQLMEYTIK